MRFYVDLEVKIWYIERVNIFYGLLFFFVFICFEVKLQTMNFLRINRHNMKFNLKQIRDEDNFNYLSSTRAAMGCNWSNNACFKESKSHKGLEPKDGEIR